MITPLPPQLRPDHPSIAASHARHQMAMGLVRRAWTATLGPVPRSRAAVIFEPTPAGDPRPAGQRAADEFREFRLHRAQQQAIDLVTGAGPGELA